MFTFKKFHLRESNHFKNQNLPVRSICGFIVFIKFGKILPLFLQIFFLNFSFSLSVSISHYFWNSSCTLVDHLISHNSPRFLFSYISPSLPPFLPLFFYPEIVWRASAMNNLLLISSSDFFFSF